MQGTVMQSSIVTTSRVASGSRPRSALIISTMTFVWGLGCGGLESGTNASTSGSAGASASKDASTVGDAESGRPVMDVSDGAADVGPDARAPPENHRVDDLQCAAPRPAGGCTLTSADGGPLGPCASDLDCQDGGVGGRCTPYDECQSDSDCGMGMLCVCHDSVYAAGAGNTCMAGDCRVDADCGPGGYCSPVHGIDTNCGNVAGYYCHTSRDECIDDSDCGGSPLDSVCAWSAVDARWECQMADVCM
jgi:hypothetical protein